MNNMELAKTTFEKKFNCAQSVISAVSADLGLNKSTALKISTGFGAGMGRLQNTCGAVTGAFMAISYKYGVDNEEDFALKEKAYTKVKEFAEEFEKLHGSISCRKLLECDLNTEEGKKTYKDNDYFNNRCMKYVKDAVKLLIEKYI